MPLTFATWYLPVPESAYCVEATWMSAYLHKAVVVADGSAAL
jgi:hypothetical protein